MTMSNLHIGPILRSLTKNKARSLLTLSMTVLTFAVVVNCLLSIAEQQQKLQQRSGFDDQHLVYLELSNFDPALTERPQVLDRIQADLEILRRTPGVVSAMSTRFKPWRGGGSSATAQRFDQGGAAAATDVRTQVYSAGPSLASTLGVPGLIGSALPSEQMADEALGRSTDRPGNVVVSRKFAETLFGDEDPLGKLFLLGGRAYTMRVVGLIDEFYNPYAWNIEQRVVFFPGYAGNADGSSFLVRVDDRRLRDLAGLEEALLTDHPLRGIKLSTIPETRRRLQTNERMTIRVLPVVIGLMIFMTAVSIVGLTAASVASRRREIGTRRALGATRLQVARHFLVENALLTAAGLMIGVAVAFGLNIALVNAMGVPKLTWSWVAVPAVLVAAVNTFVAWPLAWRASGIPPAEATKAV